MMDTTAGEKEGEPNDLDELVCQERSDEDMYLPQPISPLLQCLPDLLRNNRNSDSYHSNWTSNQLLERRKSKMSQKFRLWASCLFDPIPQAKMSCRGFVSDTSSNNMVLDSNLRNESLVLEYLPILRYIGVLERAADWAFRENKGEEQPSHRRTTRRQAKAARRHYFDTLSKQLWLDTAELPTSELGSSMAESLLEYNKKMT
jgi:hypothetical protein